MRRILAPALFFLIALSCTPLHAQERDISQSVRIGVHAGVQTGLFRYSVFPYEGEFQGTVEQSTVAGISIGMPFDAAFQLQVDIAWWKQPWSAVQDGDPKIEITRTTRSLIELPAMLQYHFLRLPVPLYIAAGPVVSLVTDAEKEYAISYTAFTERDGWKTTHRGFKEEMLHFGIAGEVGVEVPLGDRLSMQTGVRLTQPLGKTVETQEFTLSELSVWRARLGVLYAF